MLLSQLGEKQKKQKRKYPVPDNVALLSVSCSIWSGGLLRNRQRPSQPECCTLLGPHPAAPRFCSALAAKAKTLHGWRTRSPPRRGSKRNSTRRGCWSRTGQKRGAAASLGLRRARKQRSSRQPSPPPTKDHVSTNLTALHKQSPLYTNVQ